MVMNLRLDKESPLAIGVQFVVVDDPMVVELLVPGRLFFGVGAWGFRRFALKVMLKWSLTRSINIISGIVGWAQFLSRSSMTSLFIMGLVYDL
ncbi:unnamed protein product [Linum trigynum]|uniref:Uncharacterized protein n=1 Tax=Linum trigynum TaxID=586398 RepID=A0AAV2D206_9ROSI